MDNPEIITEKEKYGFPKIHNKILDGKIGLSKNLNFEARKRTDDLIKTQYYFSNYKNCVKIVPNYSALKLQKKRIMILMKYLLILKLN